LQVKNVHSELVTRFLREMGLVARLRSKHIARVIDAGITDDGVLYLARKYLAGPSVARALRAHGPFAVTDAVEYVIQTCEGLAEAHSRGVVHGDVKPYNLYLVGLPGRSLASGSIRIVDFGISKFAFSSQSNIVTSMVIGYMPPERLRTSGTVDQRSDIWSLGATLYELLTGQAAVDTSQTLGRVVTAILDEPPPDSRRARAEIPEDLSSIVGRCLAKDVEARFQSVGELAAALSPFASKRATLAERAAEHEPLLGAETPASGPVEPRPEDAQRPISPSLAPVTRTLAGVGARPAAGRQAALAHQPPDGEPEGEAEVPLNRAPRWLGIASMAAAGAAVFTAIVLSASANNGGDPFGSGAALAAQAQLSASSIRLESPTPSASPVAPDIFQLVVQASPAAAQITIDGTAVDGNPFRALYPKGGEAHRVTASADGYESKSEDVPLLSDVTVDFVLRRSAGAFESTTTPTAAPQPIAPTARPTTQARESGAAGTSPTLAAETTAATSPSP
jgi:serine/threonine-protein kinase